MKGFGMKQEEENDHFEDSMESQPNMSLMSKMVEMLENQQKMFAEMMRKKPSEVRVEGLSMPKYSGEMTESVDLFYDQCVRFFQAKNIAHIAPENEVRVKAMVASNLRGGAAAWYTSNEKSIKTVGDLFRGLEEEFVPVDLQERLRDQLYGLKQQGGGVGLETYVSKFRKIMCRVNDMSDLDKITYFIRGLMSKTRQEVQYRRCKTLAEAISIALEYERSHKDSFGKNGRDRPHRNKWGERRTRDWHKNDRLKDGSDMEICNLRTMSKEECMKKRLCFHCKKPGHTMRQCYQRQKNLKKSQTKINSFEQDEVERQSEEEDSTIVFDRLTMNVGEFKESGCRSNELIRLDGKFESQDVRILLDSGANHNVVRPGLATDVIAEGQTQVERFDGSLTSVKKMKKCRGTVVAKGMEFRDLVFTEWELPQSHDVIFGKPWFTKYQPEINWRTHEVSIPTRDDVMIVSTTQFAKQLRADNFEEVYRVKVMSTEKRSIPEFVQKLLKDYSDVFPSKLPDGLRHVVELS